MRLLLLLLAGALLGAQPKPKAAKPANEDAELEATLSEAGSSQVEYARILERHLKRYPNTEKRAELERIILQAAIDLRDRERILRYGPAVIDAGNGNPLYLDHVARALLDQEDKPSNERALKYATELANDLNARLAALKMPGATSGGRGRRLDETEYAFARSIVFQSRALGNLGRFDEAIEAARRSFSIVPTVEAAREISKWSEKKGDLGAAVDASAEAFTVIDLRSSQAERQDDRQRLAELAKKAGLSEAETGQRVLAAWDRCKQATDARRERLLAFDPNAGARDVLDFTLSGPDGAKLALASLKGKVVVFDFWATWCGPCRAQHPLYEQVKERFKQNQDVVFLAVSTDEDRNAVPAFLEANKWGKEVWFEDGLSVHLRVSSIPTTLVLDRTGAISSRLNGFIKDRFVDMLSDRIREALGE